MSRPDCLFVAEDDAPPCFGVPVYAGYCAKHQHEAQIAELEDEISETHLRLKNDPAQMDLMGRATQVMDLLEGNRQMVKTLEDRILELMAEETALRNAAAALIGAIERWGCPHEPTEDDMASEAFTKLKALL